MHGDEANQAYRTGILLETGEYEYDPYEHHGPTLYYFTLPVLALRGETTFDESTAASYRLVPAIFGAATVLLFLALVRGVGAEAAVWGAFLAAVSPAMTFYSRYYVQDAILVFFTLLTLIAGWRWLASGKVGWCLAWGVSLGLMHATKETCVLAYAASGGGLLAWYGWRRYYVGADARWPSRLRLWHVGAGIAAAAVVSVTLYSSFFTYARGPFDSIATYATYLQRAEGTGSEASHAKPWYYYLGLLLYTRRETGPVWSEGLVVVLALIGAVFAGAFRSARAGQTELSRFLAFYTILIVAAYSVISYKTPWSMLTMVGALAVMAGVGASSLIALVKTGAAKNVLRVVLAIGAAHLAYQAYRANFTYPADVRNPYVYAHTSSNFTRLVERIDRLRELHSDGYAMRVDVIRPGGDYWPLPWYLRKYDNVGYWTRIPDALGAPVTIMSPALYETIGETLTETHVVEHYSLRPGVLLQVYIEKELWDRFMEDRGN